jgi:hypothetical protein
MPRVTFDHPTVNKHLAGKGNGDAITESGRLAITTGPEQIRWSYNLNTVTYPTYAGEVVQVLSANIGDLSVGGTVSNYAMMEDVYLWFLTYMSFATQGQQSQERGYHSYNEHLVTMRYPNRDWEFTIRPKTLPGLRIGRDVVAPTWQLQAAVVQADPKAEAATIQNAIDGLDEMHAGIGYKEFNPFSMPTKTRGYSSVQEEIQGLAKRGAAFRRAFETGNYSGILDPFMAGPPKP